MSRRTKELTLQGGLMGFVQGAQQIGADYEYDRRAGMEAMRQKSLMDLRRQYAKEDASFAAGFGGDVDAYNKGLESQRITGEEDAVLAKADALKNQEMLETINKLKLDSAQLTLGAEQRQQRINDVLGEDPYREWRIEQGQADETDLKAMGMTQPAYTAMVEFNRALARSKASPSDVSQRAITEALNRSQAAFLKMSSFEQDDLLKQNGYDPETTKGPARANAFKAISLSWAFGMPEKPEEPPANVEQVRNMIQQRLAKGATPEQLQQGLMEAGYNEETIKTNFGDLFAKDKPPAAESVAADLAIIQEKTGRGSSGSNYAATGSPVDVGGKAGTFDTPGPAKNLADAATYNKQKVDELKAKAQRVEQDAASGKIGDQAKMDLLARIARNIQSLNAGLLTPELQAYLPQEEAGPPS